MAQHLKDCLPADFAHAMAHPAPHQSKVADRLLAHARLCRQMAAGATNEALGEKLLKMADDCVVAAADAIVATRPA